MIVLSLILGLLGMSQGEFTVFLAAIGGGITGVIGAILSYATKRDTIKFEEKRLEREAAAEIARLAREAAAAKEKADERIAIAKEKADERIAIAKEKAEERLAIAKEKEAERLARFELARLTKETAKGIQQSVSRSTKEVKSVVEASKQERHTQLEQLITMNSESIEKSNGYNEKLTTQGAQLIAQNESIIKIGEEVAKIPQMIPEIIHPIIQPSAEAVKVEVVSFPKEDNQ